MKNVELRIIKFLKYMEHSSDLMVSGGSNSLQSYINYFEGFFLGIEMTYNFNIERKISQWYQDKVELKAPNMYWFAQFKLFNKDKSENEKISLFLKTLEEFFLENNSIFEEEREPHRFK